MRLSGEDAEALRAGGPAETIMNFLDDSLRKAGSSVGTGAMTSARIDV